MIVKKLVAVLVLFVTVLLSPAKARGDDGYSVEVQGSLSGYASTGDRELDTSHGLVGGNAGLQTWFRTPVDFSLYLDGRYFGHNNRPENSLREGYLKWDTESLTVTAGKQIIVWGRADRFNPTDVVTPRNFEILTSEDDEQRFGVEGVQAKYHIANEYTVSAFALPAFRSSRVPSGLISPGTQENRDYEEYSSDNKQLGCKLDRTGQSLDWSVSYYRGFSTLPEVFVTSPIELTLENRNIWMAGADFASSFGSWGIRGEAAYVDFERRTLMPELYPHSYFYSVLGAEHTMTDTLTMNIQWLHRNLRDFTDPRTIPQPFGQIAMGNALIHNQFDKRQDGVSLNLRDKWLHDILLTELTSVYFFTRHDYLLRPKVEYALTDQWQLILLADIYRGPKDSFFGGLRDNTLTYAELRYQFGPLKH